MKELATDEVALVESKLKLPIQSVSEVKRLILEDCWYSLRSTEEKRIRYRRNEASILGFNSSEGGVWTGRYILNPNGEYDIYSVINETTALLASTLSVGISYQSQQSIPDNALIMQFSAERWKNIPTHIMQSMFEEIESKLRVAAFAVVYFDDFDRTLPILESFARALIKHKNIVVIMSSTYSLETKEPELPDKQINNMAEDLTVVSLPPSRKTMTRFLSLCQAGANS